MSFFVGVCMNKTRLKKTELKSIRLHIRLSEQINNYLNYCSDFFSVSKSFFIIERCISPVLVCVHDEFLDEMYFDDLKSIASEVNDVAHELNVLYNKTLETNRLDLVFKDVSFFDYTNKINLIIESWTSLFHKFIEHDVFSYHIKKDVIPDYDIYFDECLGYSSTRNKELQIRVTNSFYQLLTDVSQSFDKTISQYILDCCLMPLYLSVSSVNENKDVMTVLKSIGRNLRQIIYSLNRINKRNIECSGIQLFDLNTDYCNLHIVSETLLNSWRDFCAVLSDNEKNTFYKFIKSRELHSWIKDVDDAELVEYIKMLKNREYHI